jgi:16S rRNA (guanine527-N7)-methyltransferase
MTVSRETSDRLLLLIDLVTRWNQTINLVSPATIKDVSNRHINDSEQLLQHVQHEPSHWVDIGSGGGFPGLVVAAHLAQSAPLCQVTLIEADQRKAVFLREASRQMGLNCKVLSQRIEVAENQNADVLSARALAPLSALFTLATRHLADNAQCIFPKGRSAEQELREARQQGWNFDAIQHKSLTDPDGVILVIRNIARVDKKQP